REFEQYVNLRPIEVMEGVRTPLAHALPAGTDGGVDLVIVRENTEGEYSEVGGRRDVGQPGERAVQEATFTRAGVERVARYAFKLAGQRRSHVTSATKSNGIVHTM